MLKDDVVEMLRLAALFQVRAWLFIANWGSGILVF